MFQAIPTKHMSTNMDLCTPMVGTGPLILEKINDDRQLYNLGHMTHIYFHSTAEGNIISKSLHFLAALHLVYTWE